MPRISSRLQIAPYGTRNPAAAGRNGITPALAPRGPAQAQEAFSDVADMPTRRALLSQAQAIARATSQAKSGPFSLSRILHGIAITQGGANGATPNLIAHGLDVYPSGVVLLATYGGDCSVPVIIPNPANVPPRLVQVWFRTVTAFAGASVTCDILCYA